MQSVGVLSVGLLPAEMLLALKLVKQPIVRSGQGCPNVESVEPEPEPVPVLPACIELREGFVVTVWFLLVTPMLLLALSLANKFTTDTP